MAKDDIVLGLGRPMYGTSVHANRKKAYPSVITTLGQMEPEARQWIALHNFLCRSYQDAEIMKKRYVGVLCAEGDTLPKNYPAGFDTVDAVWVKSDQIKVKGLLLLLIEWLSHF
jgi:hypothetical protein